MQYVSKINSEHIIEHQKNSTDHPDTKIISQKRSTVPAVTHVDYSARIQTVHKDTNPIYHQLLKI